MPYRDSSRKHARSLDQALVRLPAGNGPQIKAFLEAERLRNRRQGTLYHAADFLGRLARHIDDRPLSELTGADLSSFFTALSTTLGPSSLHLAACKVRRYLRLTMSRERFFELDAYTRVGQRGRKKPFVVISPAERDALLSVARNDLEVQAILWGLWDTGMRASELVALNVGSVRFEDDGGAWIEIPNDGEDLKTGSRTVYVMECVGALRAWLGAHPLAGDATAPLFVAFRGRHHHKRLWPNTINDKLIRLCRRAGLRRMNPHLFRHTRATRAARDNWSKPKANAFFGWSPNSTEWDTYVHLVDADIREQVRRDAGVDPLGKLVREDPRAALQAAVGAAVAETLRSVGLVAQSPPPTVRRDPGQAGSGPAHAGAASSG